MSDESGMAPEETMTMSEIELQNPKLAPSLRSGQALERSEGSKIQNPTDLLGAPLSAAEQELLGAYEALKGLAGRDDLPPCAARNVRRALAALWQATNDLDLQFEQLYDLGV